MKSVKSVSIVICSKDRADALQRCLASLEALESPQIPVELVLVDNASADHTPDVCKAYKQRSKWSVVTGCCRAPGLGNARNFGINLSSGELLVFTDDDCLLDRDFLVNLVATFDLRYYRYGGGQILLLHEDDDERIANLRLEATDVIAKNRPYLHTGLVQGANMYVHRSVIKKIGGFNPLMGAGTRFPCEDIEFVQRASEAGFTGVRLANVIVHHDHGRKQGSAQAEKVVQGYQYGRGAYYGALLHRGLGSPWKAWMHRFSQRNTHDKDFYAMLISEFRGAADYLEELARRRDAGRRMPGERVADKGRSRK